MVCRPETRCVPEMPHKDAAESVEGRSGDTKPHGEGARGEARGGPFVTSTFMNARPDGALNLEKGTSVPSYSFLRSEVKSNAADRRGVLPSCDETSSERTSRPCG